jgi:23S rRNA (guanine745-N1)-methyltransferase
MVAARRRVHESGVLDAVVGGVADAVAAALAHSDTPAGQVILDAGAGAGHYLRACTQGRDDARGIGLDLSKYCARAVARGEPPMAAVVADVWRPLPVASDAVDVILSIFSPRNVSEFARVARPGATLVVVTPEPGHLAELIEPMGMLSVAADKDERVRAPLADRFDEVSRDRLTDTATADRHVIADLVAMGPSAFHRSGTDIARDATLLADTSGSTVEVTVDVSVGVWTQRNSD